jgi:hypothetical protein
MGRLGLYFLALAGSLILTLAAPAAEKEQASQVKVDKQKRTITIDAKIAPRKLEYLKGEIYPIEVIACWAHPKGKKAHETVVTIEARPSEVHEAMLSLGVKPGKPVMGQSDEPPQGPEVQLFIEITREDGKPRRIPIEKTLIDPKTGKPMPRVSWRFTGSALTKPDPNKDETVYGADQTGTLIAIFPVTNETVFQTSLTMKEEKYLKLETNKKLLPKEGALVKLVIVAAKGK